MHTKQVDTSTLQGLKRAERLQALGWKPIAINPITNVVTLVKAYQKPRKNHKR
jgi:hypothetical protein